MVLLVFGASVFERVGVRGGFAACSRCAYWPAPVTIDTDGPVADELGRELTVAACPVFVDFQHAHEA